VKGGGGGGDKKNRKEKDLITYVVQQDNAGPRIEEKYSTWIHDQFDE
jgi:hypothetical protein